MVSCPFVNDVEMPAPLAYVVEATHCGTPLFQVSSWPPVPVPKSVEVAWKLGTAEPDAALVRTPFDAAPKEVTLLPEEVTAPLKLAFVVTVAALPPIESEEVATWRNAVPAAFVYRSELPLRDERPVPPLAIATVPVTLDAVPPMLRVEVESAVTFPVAPVLLPRMVFAPIVGS
jgi:hypothetical protein